VANSLNRGATCGQLPRVVIQPIYQFSQRQAAISQIAQPVSRGSQIGIWRLALRYDKAVACTSDRTMATTKARTDRIGMKTSGSRLGGFAHLQDMNHVIKTMGAASGVIASMLRLRRE
jgi:hypothetical protein